MPGMSVAEEERISIREAMIDAVVLLSPVRPVQRLVFEVLALSEFIDRRFVRQRPEVEYLAGDRVKPVRWNDVVRKLITNLTLSIRIGTRRSRIVDGDQLSLGVAEVAEITL